MPRRLNHRKPSKYYNNKFVKKVKQQIVSKYVPLAKAKFVKKELESPDVINAIAVILNHYIQNNANTKPRKYGGVFYPKPRIFNTLDSSEAPNINDIKIFIQKVFDKRRLQLESGIVALIFLKRTGIRITSKNWMRLLLVSLLLANKHAEDTYKVCNSRFVGLIPNVENLEINVLELEFLRLLKYRLHIETNTYDHYYEKLRNLTPDPSPTVTNDYVEDADTVVDMTHVDIEEMRGSGSILCKSTGQ